MIADKTPGERGGSSGDAPTALSSAQAPWEPGRRGDNPTVTPMCSEKISGEMFSNVLIQ